VQRQPRKGRKDRSSQQVLIERAEEAHKEVTRLRKRKPKGVARRKLR
jgi:polyphosphate kinase